jgi:hypothetical protein
MDFARGLTDFSFGDFLLQTIYVGNVAHSQGGY